MYIEGLQKLNDIVNDLCNEMLQKVKLCDNPMDYCTGIKEMVDIMDSITFIINKSSSIYNADDSNFLEYQCVIESLLDTCTYENFYPVLSAIDAILQSFT